MYLAYVQQPLHNLLLWLISLTPGNSLALGILLFALIVKVVLFVFIYHGHITNLTHHHLSKQISSLHKKHHAKSDEFKNELHLLYKHYSFNPWKGLFVTLIQFIVFFSILSFLYSGSTVSFHRLDLATMDNIFVSTVMNFNLGVINLIKPLTTWWALLCVGIVQFISLEMYLLTKRQIHTHPKHEEKIEHIFNLILSLVVVWMAFNLPAVLSLYWFYYLLLGIFRKVMFSMFIDHHILAKLEQMEKKFIKKEEPVVRKFDEGIVYYLWKLFNPKQPSKKFIEIKHRAEKKLYAFHHRNFLHHSQKKVYEEPHLAALIIFTLILLYLISSSLK